MRRGYDSEYEDKEIFSPWETYSDLYCGLLLVFVLLFFFAIYQYIDARERNDADTAALQQEMREEQDSVLAIYKTDLEEQEKAYEQKNQELENQQSAMAIVRADLDERTDQLDAQQALIDSQKAELETKQDELAAQQQLVGEQQTQLETQQTQLATQQEQLEAAQGQLAVQQEQLTVQQEQLVAQQTQLDAQAVQIEQIVGVRGQLIEELNQALTASEIQIQADKTTGAILFESSILFPTDGNELSEEGKEFFQRFMPVYMNVLLQPQFQEYIGEIIVEGHTDDTGSYLHNLELSQQRAWSVAEYFLSEDCQFLTADTQNLLKSLITVNGCANKSPIYNEDGTVNADRSRRVEIKFRLKDQEMIQEMDAILNKQESEEGQGQ